MELQTLTPSHSRKVDHVLIAGRTRGDVKLAQRAASLLQQEIISGRFGNGHSLGTAAEIRARYNLGRAAFREAVGILELRGVARLRPGPGGGVVVAEPDFDSLVNLTLLYLYATPLGVRELVEAERAILSAVVQRLLGMFDQLEPSKLPSNWSQGGFPRFLARAIGNPAIELAVEFVERVREACMTPLAVRSDLEKRLWQAVCLGQDAAALSALDGYLATRAHCSADIASSLKDYSKSGPGSGKSAYRLALRLLQEIVNQPNEWTDTLGSEGAMADRFNASADIVRQAVRLIEDLEVVEPRRGRNGGVLLRTPDTASIASLIPHLLAKQQLSVSTCFEAAGLLNVEIVRLAAIRTKDKGCSQDAEPSDETADPWAMILLDRRIQAYAGNALLASIERGLLLYSCFVEPPNPAAPVPMEKMMTLSQEILRAIEDSDVERASAALQERFQLMSLRFTDLVRFKALQLS